MKQLNIKKLVLLNLPLLPAGPVRNQPGGSLAAGDRRGCVCQDALILLHPAGGAGELVAQPAPAGFAGGALLRRWPAAGGVSERQERQKYRHNVEYGSARWGTHEDIAPYIDPVFQNNVILTQTERLTMSSPSQEPKYARNKNVLVIGGSGSGKTRFWLKPNLMQMHSSYVVTDPKGTILVECGKMLQRGAPKLGKDGKPVKDKNGKIVYEP